MAEIAPLTPLRFDPAMLADGLGAVVAPPYDVISEAERRVLAARDPHNVVRLILPEGDADAKYEGAARALTSWRERGILMRDNEPAFYRYDQTFSPPGEGGGQALRRRGFLALVRLAPLGAGIVLPHERTLTGPKEDRLKLFRATRANLSPGFMLYRDPKNSLEAPLAGGRSIAEFSTADGVHHALAKITGGDALRAIVEQVAASSLLIADGHHRYETALRYQDEVSASAPAAADGAEHRYFMTFLVNGDDPNLVVFPTHRHVHALPSFSFADLKARATSLFDVAPVAAGWSVPAILRALAERGKRGPSLVAVAPDGEAIMLTLKDDADLAKSPSLAAKPAVLRRTDVALLHHGILEGMLGVTAEAQAAKTHVWYPQDAVAAVAELRAGAGQVLFLLNPTPVAQVRQVAEAGEVMPQKSTFFYPKVLTGLAFHTLDPNRTVGSV
jgi:uncharacterized protein (DUF1015 family)